MSIKSKAKFYIYRNLRTDTFSVKFKGKVIDRPFNLVAYNVEFKVSKSGRDRVLRDKRKNVHATVVCERYSIIPSKSLPLLSITGRHISYNPYKLPYFYYVDDESKVMQTGSVTMTCGKFIQLNLDNRGVLKKCLKR